MVVNFPSASLRKPAPLGERVQLRTHRLRAGRLGGHPQLGTDLPDHDRQVRLPHHVRDPLVVLRQDHLVHAALALRHQQHRTARDLPGSLRRRRFPLRFGAQLFDHPTRDSLGDGELLQLVAHLLKLLAQLLCPRLQFGPAGRDRLTKARFRSPVHLVHLSPESYGQAPRSRRGTRASAITETADDLEFRQPSVSSTSTRSPTHTSHVTSDFKMVDLQ
ncbi:hypothetical protein [Streptomyces scopuliridis]|uniref:hypothetical protein n=1 Tax=Streptomyces scopuliridis TaxID=452529 RepID=UPI0036966500